MTTQNIAIYIGRDCRLEVLDITGIADPARVDSLVGNRNWYGISGDNKEAMAIVEFCRREQAAAALQAPVQRRHPEPK